MTPDWKVRAAEVPEIELPKSWVRRFETHLYVHLRTFDNELEVRGDLYPYVRVRVMEAHRQAMAGAGKAAAYDQLLRQAALDAGDGGPPREDVRT